MTPAAGSAVVICDERFGRAGQTIAYEREAEVDVADVEAHSSSDMKYVESVQTEPTEETEVDSAVVCEETESGSVTDGRSEDDDLWNTCETPGGSCLSTQSSVEEWEPKSPPAEKVSDDANMNENVEKTTPTNGKEHEVSELQVAEECSPISITGDFQSSASSPREAPPSEKEREVSEMPVIEECSPVSITGDFQSNTSSTREAPSSPAPLVTQDAPASPVTSQTCVRQLAFDTDDHDTETDGFSAALKETAALAAEACERLHTTMGIPPAAGRTDAEEPAADVSLDETIQHAVENAREVRALMCKLREMVGTRQPQDATQDGNTSECSPFGTIRAMLSESRPSRTQSSA